MDGWMDGWMDVRVCVKRRECGQGWKEDQRARNVSQYVVGTISLRRLAIGYAHHGRIPYCLDAILSNTTITRSGNIIH